MAQLRTQVVATGLTNPVAFVVDPGDPSTFYVVEQRGTIRTVRNNVVSATFALDVRTQISAGGERGLLGLAFPPDAVESRRVFVNFTNPDGHTVVARYTRDAQGRFEAASRFDLMWPDGRRFIEQPFSNHNGGHLAFGPDGYLYIGLGDGGSGGDPHATTRRIPISLLGKMLRIDVSVPDSDPRGYRVPEDNPFVDRQPIAALGRNLGVRAAQPLALQLRRLDARRHRRAGRSPTSARRAREEVNWEPRGAGGRNYGWRLREGRAAYDARQPAAYPAAHRTDSRLPEKRRRVDHRRLRLSRRGAARRCSTGGISSPTTSPGASITIGLSLNETPGSDGRGRAGAHHHPWRHHRAGADQLVWRRCRRRDIYSQLFARPNLEDRSRNNQ